MKANNYDTKFNNTQQVQANDKAKENISRQIETMRDSDENIVHSLEAFEARTPDGEANTTDSVANEILTLSRNTLLVNLRFMDMALSLHEREKNKDIHACLSTNGDKLYYHPRKLLEEYKKDQNSINRNYLHTVLHCVFQHPFITTLVDKDCWDLACDIAVENAIIDLELSSVKAGREYSQYELLNLVETKVKHMTAEKIYRWLLEQDYDDDEMARMREPFMADDHGVWYAPLVSVTAMMGGIDIETAGNWKMDFTTKRGSDSEGEPEASDEDKDGDPKASTSSSEQHQGGMVSNPNYEGDEQKNELKDKWEEVAHRMQTDMETFSSRMRGMGTGGIMASLQAVTREKYNYEKFLKQFSVMGEQMKINDDEFDYIFYTYGLKLYDNMPLIEPLEYKEMKKIREFVIAIDTSGSVSGQLVQTFLKKTYNIFKQEESMFKKFRIHIIQCDSEIKEDKVVTNQEEFDEYIENMTLKGFGGTDFRPVFNYVQELRDAKEFINLKGLIYFTDGYGEFPKEKTDYNTAFVFIDDEYGIPEVPPWAIKLVLQSDEI